jgi:glycosyltransferase involved in cell wall biosynthesis
MSSSSVLAAMSFHRPVIVPALGCLPEWVPSDCGILYDPKDADGLRQAMVSARQMDLVQMGENAYQHVLGFSWEQVAETTLIAYGCPANGFGS